MRTTTGAAVAVTSSSFLRSLTTQVLLSLVVAFGCGGQAKSKAPTSPAPAVAAIAPAAPIAPVSAPDQAKSEPPVINSAPISADPSEMPANLPADSTVPPAPAASVSPQSVPPRVLSSLRSAGETAIQPPADAALAIAQSGQSKLVATLKFCIDTNGVVEKVTLLKSSGFPDYDKTLESTILTTWRYRPFLVNGAAVGVCSVVTFVYQVPPTTPEINVAPKVVAALRIAGEQNISPNMLTERELNRIGARRLVGTVKLCLDTSGKVTRVIVIKSTTVPAYDNKIVNTIKDTWRYSPFLVDGRAEPVCSAVTFVYTRAPNGPWKM
jgi:outer membrane biosynthesis protein TonB